MKKIGTFLAVAVLLSSAAQAGEILGKVTSGAASVGEGTTIEAKCGGTAYPAVKTDKNGAYHLVVKETGKCTLTIGHKGQSASVEVVSYDDAAEADIVLEVKEGKLTARRK